MVRKYFLERTTTSQNNIEPVRTPLGFLNTGKTLGGVCIFLTFYKHMTLPFDSAEHQAEP
jgi:hypothetical protein